MFKDHENDKGGFRIKWLDDTNALVVFADAGVGKFLLFPREIEKGSPLGAGPIVTRRLRGWVRIASGRVRYRLETAMCLGSAAAARGRCSVYTRNESLHFSSKAVSIPKTDKTS